jgi:hypothetical protein
MIFIKDFNHRNFDSVSEPLKFRKYLYFRQIVRSATCPFGEKSIRQNVRLAKCQYGKMSVRQNVRRQNVRSENVFRQNVFRENVRPPHIYLFFIAMQTCQELITSKEFEFFRKSYITTVAMATMTFQNGGYFGFN